MDKNVFLNRRREVAKQKPRLEEVIRGSIVIIKRSCGKAGCRCQKGQKHRGLYVSQSYKGKTRTIYIPQRSEKKVRELISNYRKFKAVMDKISNVNIKMLTQGQR